jgi:hypothetical protein
MSKEANLIKEVNSTDTEPSSLVSVPCVELQMSLMAIIQTS